MFSFILIDLLKKFNLSDKNIIIITVMFYLIAGAVLLPFFYEINNSFKAFIPILLLFIVGFIIRLYYIKKYLKMKSK